MKTESERVESAPIVEESFSFAEERERFLQECRALYCSERPLSEVVPETKRLADLRNSHTIADKPSQMPLAERASPIDKASAADASRATSEEQQSAERPATLQAATEQLHAGRAAAKKAIATKTAPEQHSTLKHTVEPVRARGKLPLIWLVAAAILMAIVTAMTATAYLPYERAREAISAPAFTPTPESPPTTGSSPSPAVSPDSTARPDAGSAPDTASEIKTLVKRADMLVGRGDLAAARLFYERAVDAGDATAAIYLGTTYDPSFLSRARLGKTVRGDLGTAAYWYRRARDLGSGEAEALLKAVHNNGSPGYK
jgi:hypothetical protein